MVSAPSGMAFINYTRATSNLLAKFHKIHCWTTEIWVVEKN